MVRPIKKGLDYLPLDVNARDDDKISYLINKRGYEGYGVWIAILQEVYKVGYCYRASEFELTALSYKLHFSLDKVKLILKTCLEADLFDAKIFEEHEFLTSKGIQSRFFFCTGRRRDIKVISELMLVSEDEYPNNINIISILDIKDKEKKSKVKKSKVKVTLQQVAITQHKLCNNSAITQQIEIDPKLTEVAGYKEGLDLFEDHVWMKFEDYEKLIKQFPVSRVHAKIISMNAQIENGIRKYTNYSDHYKCFLNWLTTDQADGKFRNDKTALELKAQGLNLKEEDFNVHG